MSFFSVIILLSVGLAALALVGGAATILSQVIRKHLETKRSLRRETILKGILQGLESSDWDLSLIENMSHNRRLCAGLFSEISELIRGENRDRVLALCREAAIDRWLLRQLKSWNSEHRRLAADTLGLIPGEESISALLGALDDRSEEVRITAASSLAALNAMPPLGLLMEKLIESTSAQSLLLQRLLDSAALSRPAEVMELAKGIARLDFLRPLALSALGKAGHLDLSNEIATFVADDDPEVRAAALASVAALGDFSAKEHIKTALLDPVSFVRIRAIAATLALELRELAPEMRLLLDDKNWWVKFRASEALAIMGESVPGDRVLEALPAPMTRALAG